MTQNGTRSRASTPGEVDFSENTSAVNDSDKEKDSEGKIKVGPEYQAQIPEMLPSEDRNPDCCGERGLLMWAPSMKASDNQIAKYATVSQEKYSYSLEQSLGMLFWHNYNFEKALADLPNYTPQPEEWSVEDKVLFEQAFSFHGKNFHKIHQMLPEKGIHSLVKYYYLWKKSRSRTSLMDRQAKKLAAQREDGTLQISEQSSESDEDNKDSTESDNGGRGQCSNCGIACLITNTTSKGVMCNTCYNYFKRHGTLRPTVGPMRTDRKDRPHSLLSKKSYLPRGMHINHEDLVQFASAEGSQVLMSRLEQQISDLKRQIQNGKQSVGILRRKTLLTVAPYRLPTATAKVSPRWTNDEVMLAVKALRKYGKNFEAVADIIGTKTVQHLRLFYSNNKKRYNLETLIREHDQERSGDSQNSTAGLLNSPEK